MEKKLLAVLLLSALPGVCRADLFPPHAFSDAARGLTAASFLKSPASARLSALGFGAATLRAPDAFFYNPAGAAYLPAGRQTFLLGYESLLEGSGRGAGAWLKGLERGALGFGAVYRYETGLTKYDLYGDAAGGFDAYDAAFSGFYGARTKSVDAGVAVKYIRSKLYNRSAGAAALDLGVILKDRKNDGVDVAFFARNLGTSMKLGSERAPLPAELGGALSWRYVPRLGVFLDARMPADHSPYLVLAGEYAIPFEGASGMLLRAGLNFKNNADLGIMGVLSAGFGIRIKDTGFDYAFVPYGDLGVTHRFTISRGFGAASVPGGPSPDAGDFTAKRRGARAEKLSMAVAAFEPGDGVNKNLARLVSDLVEAELLKTPGFKLIERTNTKYIVSEKKLASAGLGNKERSLELARLTGARGVLYGDVLKTEKGYLIAVKLAAAATGEVLASESRPAEDDYLLPQTARELAAALAAD